VKVWSHSLRLIRFSHDLIQWLELKCSQSCQLTQFIVISKNSPLCFKFLNFCFINTSAKGYFLASNYLLCRCNSWSIRFPLGLPGKDYFLEFLHNFVRYNWSAFFWSLLDAFKFQSSLCSFALPLELWNIILYILLELFPKQFNRFFCFTSYKSY